ncbi:DUF2017 domain-containing protein [Haematomicrobium sanguinis]|uniref:DUF2017 domain-containing protein n=1 Tax=Haematomicrobium sanguinis TaxID=479106 RepID=UPI00047A1B9C|nr:DUF2017 domain-containing protein [Haematomicrobium sanguinis]
MSSEFKSTPRGIIAHLEPAEKQLLSKLFTDVIEMLEIPTDDDPLAAMVGLDEEVERPADAAVARLLPDAVKNDGDASLEFRRLTERSLRQAKVANLRAAQYLAEGDSLTLSAEQAMVFVKALTDVRLVIAARLGLETDEDAEKLQGITDATDVTDVDSYLTLIYHFLTAMQESLVGAIMVDERD